MKYKENCFAFRRKTNGAAMCNALTKLDCAKCVWFKDKTDYSVECDKICRRKERESDEA